MVNGAGRILNNSFFALSYNFKLKITFESMQLFLDFANGKSTVNEI